MELLGWAGLVLTLVGIVGGAIAIGALIRQRHDLERRAYLLRVTLTCAAATNVGIAIFVVSRPAEVLRNPLNFALAIVFLLLAARLGARAVQLRGPDPR